MLSNCVRSLYRLNRTSSIYSFVRSKSVSLIFSHSSPERRDFTQYLPKRFFCSVESIPPVTVKGPRHVPLTPDVIEKLTAGDAEKTELLKLIEFEFEVAKQDGCRSPSELTYENWKELLRLSNSGRKKYLAFLFNKEITKINEKKKKEERRKEREAQLAVFKAAEQEVLASKDSHLIYKLLNNCIHLRIYDSTIERYNNGRIIRASCFDEPVVFDLSYHSKMTRREQKNAVSQLRGAFALNRDHKRPLPIQFCNADYDSYMMEEMYNAFPTLQSPEHPINVSSQSYLDMFPKEKLVYLTPHCHHVMTHFDPESVYIIGALVDKTNNDPLSLAKAKKEGLKMVKLPLDGYLNWGSGSSKSLTLNAVMGILLEVRLHGKWDLALKQHVAKRKFIEPEEQQMVTPNNFIRKQRINDLLFTDNVSRRMPPRTDSGRQNRFIINKESFRK